jgi:hypothetical protein
VAAHPDIERAKVINNIPCSHCIPSSSVAVGVPPL